MGNSGVSGREERERAAGPRRKEPSSRLWDERSECNDDDASRSGHARRTAIATSTSTWTCGGNRRTRTRTPRGFSGDYDDVCA